MPRTRLYTDAFTAEDALQLLQEGNFRFINDMRQHRDLLDEVTHTASGQKPFAAVLSCMDSRTSGELVFDQGLGDIFSLRIAGNVVSATMIGSLEYATVVAGAKLIVVMGHSQCGAIKGACDSVAMGHLTNVLARIQPAVQMAQTPGPRDSSNEAFVQEVAEINVRNSIAQILSRSAAIAGLAHEGNLMVVGAMYNIVTGKVSWMD